MRPGIVTHPIKTFTGFLTRGRQQIEDGGETQPQEEENVHFKPRARCRVFRVHSKSFHSIVKRLRKGKKKHSILEYIVVHINNNHFDSLGLI